MFSSIPIAYKAEHAARGLPRLTRDQKTCGLYLAIIFATLLTWGFGVFCLYRFIGGPETVVSDRINSSAGSMIPRLIFFLKILLVVKLFGFIKQSKDTPLLDYVKQHFKGDPFWVLRIMGLMLLGIISFVYLQVNFMSLKTAIPSLQPFYFDDAAKSLDKILFLDTDPWKVFAWLYDFPNIVMAIDRVYTAWAVLIAGVWIYAFLPGPMSRQRRFQYIFSMILIWFIAGNIMAIVLSSAGPCYYHIFGSDPEYYAELMARLASLDASVNLGAVDYHDVLLYMYENSESRIGGISAAPSLHVATSLLLLIFFWKNLITRILLIAFNIIIYVGSIILAWHYAIDGLISIPLAVLCWYLAGKITHSIESKWPAADSRAKLEAETA